MLILYQATRIIGCVIFALVSAFFGLGFSLAISDALRYPSSSLITFKFLFSLTWAIIAAVCAYSWYLKVNIKADFYSANSWERRFRNLSTILLWSIGFGIMFLFSTIDNPPTTVMFIVVSVLSSVVVIGIGYLFSKVTTQWRVRFESNYTKLKNKHRGSSRTSETRAAQSLAVQERTNQQNSQASLVSTRQGSLRNRIYDQDQTKRDTLNPQKTQEQADEQQKNVFIVPQKRSDGQTSSKRAKEKTGSDLLISINSSSEQAVRKLSEEQQSSGLLIPTNSSTPQITRKEPEEVQSGDLLILINGSDPQIIRKQTDNQEGAALIVPTSRLSHQLARKRTEDQEGPALIVPTSRGNHQVARKAQHPEKLPYTDINTLAAGQYVYVIREQLHGKYKIGKAKNPYRRLSTFGVQLPYEVRPIFIIPCEDMSSLELTLHRKFANSRLNGEWFDLDDSDLDEIRSSYKVIEIE